MSAGNHDVPRDLADLRLEMLCKTTANNDKNHIHTCIHIPKQKIGVELESCCLKDYFLTSIIA